MQKLSNGMMYIGGALIVGSFLFQNCLFTVYPGEKVILVYRLYSKIILKDYCRM